MKSLLIPAHLAYRVQTRRPDAQLYQITAFPGKHGSWSSSVEGVRVRASVAGE